MKVDRQERLFVAGGTGGDGRVIDTESGETLAEYPFTTAASFVNDVVLTRGGAWFTDSAQAQLYLVPFSDDDECRGGGHGGCRGGHDHGDDLPDPADVETLPLTGAWVQPAGFSANGIAHTPDHDALIVMNSSTGQLFRVDPESGEATLVDLGGATVAQRRRAAPGGRPHAAGRAEPAQPDLGPPAGLGRRVGRGDEDHHVRELRRPDHGRALGQAPLPPERQVRGHADPGHDVRGPSVSAR